MIPNRWTFCPVIFSLVMNARSLTLMRHPGWATAVANAITELSAQQKR